MTRVGEFCVVECICCNSVVDVFLLVWAGGIVFCTFGCMGLGVVFGYVYVRLCGCVVVCLRVCVVKRLCVIVCLWICGSFVGLYV